MAQLAHIGIRHGDEAECGCRFRKTDGAVEFDVLDDMNAATLVVDLGPGQAQRFTRAHTAIGHGLQDELVAPALTAKPPIGHVQPCPHNLQYRLYLGDAGRLVRHR